MECGDLLGRDTNDKIDSIKKEMHEDLKDSFIGIEEAMKKRNQRFRGTVYDTHGDLLKR